MAPGSSPDLPPEMYSPQQYMGTNDIPPPPGEGYPPDGYAEGDISHEMPRAYQPKAGDPACILQFIGGTRITIWGVSRQDVLQHIESMESMERVLHYITYPCVGEMMDAASINISGIECIFNARIVPINPPQGPTRPRIHVPAIFGG